jgi:hypothetical protein
MFAIVPNSIDDEPMDDGDIAAGTKEAALRFADELSGLETVDVVVIYDNDGIPDSTTRTKEE